MTEEQFIDILSEKLITYMKKLLESGEDLSDVYTPDELVVLKKSFGIKEK